VYSIEKHNDLYKIECEEHGEFYPGWRSLGEIPAKLIAPLIAIELQTSEVESGVIDGLGEKVAPGKYLIY
jgi:hypothetical protein